MTQITKFKKYDRVKVSFEGHLYVAEVMNYIGGSDPPRYRIKLTGVETRSVSCIEAPA